MVFFSDSKLPVRRARPDRQARRLRGLDPRADGRLRAPGRFPKGAVIQNRVRNLDLAPTFLDAAGAPRPPQFEGKSVLPLAEGKVKPEDWKEQDFVYEYYWEWTFPDADDLRH
ncbi:sulfatase/phosphatase domain-containing protein [Caulobacter segnis]